MREIFKKVDNIEKKWNSAHKDCQSSPKTNLGDIINQYKKINLKDIVNQYQKSILEKSNWWIEIKSSDRHEEIKSTLYNVNIDVSMLKFLVWTTTWSKKRFVNLEMRLTCDPTLKYINSYIGHIYMLIWKLFCTNINYL